MIDASECCAVRDVRRSTFDIRRGLGCREVSGANSTFDVRRSIFEVEAAARADDGTDGARLCFNHLDRDGSSP
jgi:hypothetical protein